MIRFKIKNKVLKNITLRSNKKKIMFKKVTLKIISKLNVIYKI